MTFLFHVGTAPYEAPEGDAVDFAFTGGYTPPAGGTVDFDFDA